MFGTLHAHELAHDWKMTLGVPFFIEIVLCCVSVSCSCVQCSLSDGSIWSSPEFLRCDRMTSDRRIFHFFRRRVFVFFCNSGVVSWFHHLHDFACCAWCTLGAVFGAAFVSFSACVLVDAYFGFCCMAGVCCHSSYTSSMSVLGGR